MSGDWIPMRCNLSEAPEVGTIAKHLGLDQFGVVGRLHRLWSWFNQHTVNGNADVTLDFLDCHVATKGFAEILVKVGWLKIDQCNGVILPKFDRYNAESARKRELTRLRVARWRNAGGNASVTRVKRKMLRLQKRREDINKKKRACALPNDFAPNDTHRTLAARLGVDLDDALVEFRDHAAANGRVLMDWDAGFRTWLRNKPKFDRPMRNGASATVPAGMQSISAVVAVQGDLLGKP